MLDVGGAHQQHLQQVFGFPLQSPGKDGLAAGSLEKLVFVDVRFVDFHTVKQPRPHDLAADQDRKQIGRCNVESRADICFETANVVRQL